MDVDVNGADGVGLPGADIENAPAGAEQPHPVTPASAGTGPDTAPTRTAVALSNLSTLSELPLAEHAEVFQLIHGELQSALAEIDTD